MGRGSRDPRPGRPAIDWNRFGGLESTFVAMPTSDMRKFQKIGKKISVEKINAAINVRISPIFLHIWKALGRPRRMVPPCQQQISTGEALLGGQRSIFSIFRRQCPH